MSEFDELIYDLKLFQIKRKLIDENELESLLESYLKQKGWILARQKIIDVGRNDLVVERNSKKICLELKLETNMSIVGQIGKYVSRYDDGVIIVCWKASKELRDFIKKMNVSQKWPPLEVIQIIQNQGVF